jgi:chloramphenicol-sensitive protein RarD
MHLNKGLLYAASAYILWGIFPIFFKALHQVPATQIVAHRIVWSFLFLIVVIAARQELFAFKGVINRRTLLIYLGAGLLLAVNWLVYVWSVNSGYVVEASLGYFINPLVSVVMGVFILRERLRPVQWLPVGLAAMGVAYLTLSFGALPWIALVLALTFGMYGLVKKVAPLGSLYGLTMETGMVFLPAIVFLLVEDRLGVGAYARAGLWTTILLSLTGVVTAIPLLMFASGARRVPLSTMGLLQYITPTLQFILGVYVFGEPFSQARLVGFSMIWLALIVFSVESFIYWRKVSGLTVPLPVESKA